MEIRQDVCGICGGFLEWGFEPMEDSGRCPDCGETYYPADSEDMETE